MAVVDGAVVVVLADHHLGAGDLGGGLILQLAHELRHVPQAVQAGHHQVVGLLSVVAVLLIKGVQGVEEGHALGGVPGGHLGEEHGGGDGVLVPDVVAQHVAVALLIGEDDLALASGLQGVLLLRHELEAGEGIVAGDAVGLGHLAGHLGGDDGLQGYGMFGHLPGAAHGADEVVQQQHAGLVAGDGLILALGVAH